MALDASQLRLLAGHLDEIRLAVKRDGERRAVRAGANVIREAMVERTPVNIERSVGSDSLPSGAVKADIKVRFPSSENEDEVTARIGPGEKTAYVARWVEYGHRMVTGGQSHINAAGKLVGHGKVHEQDVPGHPFLRPAFEASQEAALDAVKATLAELIGEASK